MIIKHKDYENGYCFLKSTTNKELQNILKKYGDDFRCVICNRNTARNFKVTPRFPGEICKSPITINNNLNDGCFFINNLS